MGSQNGNSFRGLTIPFADLLRCFDNFLTALETARLQARSRPPLNGDKRDPDLGVHEKGSRYDDSFTCPRGSSPGARGVCDHLARRRGFRSSD